MHPPHFLYSLRLVFFLHHKAADGKDSVYWAFSQFCIFRSFGGMSTFNGLVDDMTKIFRIFIFVTGTLLSLTAIAKFISAFGNARILQEADPILAIPFRDVFWMAGALELTVSMVCLLGKRLVMQAGLVAWLATAFLFYRLGLIWVGYRKPCSCLGNLTDALHIPPQTADTALKIILAYLLIGSYATLFWLWRQRNKAISSAIGATFL